MIEINTDININKQEKPYSDSSGNKFSKVLVLDDDPNICRMLDKLLSRLNYKVSSVFNGEDAVQEYKKKMKGKDKFDFIILESSIANSIGIEKLIKQLHHIDPNVKAIVSSSFINCPIFENYKKLGFQSILPKPYNFSQLKAVLDNISPNII